MTRSHLSSTLQRRSVLPLALPLLVVLLAACGSSGQRSASAEDLIHVHGLGKSPEGLYVATHNGLYEVAGDQIRPVGDATHDLMGLTVAGPEELLASGHPDLRDKSLQAPGKPPLLGLVHSTDGQSWKSLSLLGDADFHSLEAAHDQVYGFDGTSGRFMVTGDRKRWETRAEGVGIFDFAVSPEDPNRIVATTQSGVGRSDDGGRTWKAASSEQLGFITWTGDGLYAVGPAGAVLSSDDEGTTWTPVGTLPGQAEALYADSGTLYAAVSKKGIFESTDGGKTFDVLVDTSG